MDLLVLALSPVLVVLITSGVKKMQSVSVSENKAVWLRLLVTLLAVVSSAINSWVNGSDFDVASAETLVNGFLVALSSQGLYFLSKN